MANTTLRNSFFDYFSVITPSKTLLLFLVGLLIGGISIIINFYAIFISVSIVILYGSILAYFQYKQLVPFTQAIKNSPYFMGFLFTLFALFMIFSEARETIDFEYFLNKIGIAILTTIAGLVMRQVLFHLDPSQDEQVEVIQEISDKLKEDAENYKKAGKRFFEFIEEFLVFKEELYVREKEISEFYISSLKRGIEIFSKIEQEFPSQIESLTDTINQTLSDFKFSNQNIIEVQNEAVSIFNKVKEELNIYIERLSQIVTYSNKIEMTISKLISNFEKLAESVTAQTEKFNNILGPRLEHLDSEIDAINILINDFIKLIKKQLARKAA